jgi:hypothetical protein
LFAARVCSNHFQKVIIIESEEWLATAEGLQDNRRRASDSGHPQPKRSHVAQYTATHAYHAFISFALKRLFPNVKEELERGGGRYVALRKRCLYCTGLNFKLRMTPAEAIIHMSGVPQLPPRYLFPKDKTLEVIFATRPLFETTLRRMVLESCPNVTYQPGSVIGVLRDNSSTNQLAGVKVRSKEGKETHIPASLVVGLHRYPSITLVVLTNVACVAHFTQIVLGLRLADGVG